MNSSTSVYSDPTSPILSSVGTSTMPAPPERAVWIFVLIEMLYIVIFIVIMVVIHFTGYLKNDDDALTIHHKIHGQMIESQEKNFVDEQQKNLANAGPSLYCTVKRNGVCGGLCLFVFVFVRDLKWSRQVRNLFLEQFLTNSDWHLSKLSDEEFNRKRDHLMRCIARMSRSLPGNILGRSQFWNQEMEHYVEVLDTRAHYTLDLPKAISLKYFSGRELLDVVTKMHPISFVRFLRISKAIHELISSNFTQFRIRIKDSTLFHHERDGLCYGRGENFFNKSSMNQNYVSIYHPPTIVPFTFARWSKCSAERISSWMRGEEIVEIVQMWKAGNWTTEMATAVTCFSQVNNGQLNRMKQGSVSYTTNKRHLLFVSNPEGVYLLLTAAYDHGSASIFRIFTNNRSLADLIQTDQEEYLYSAPFDYSSYPGDPDSSFDPLAFFQLLQKYTTCGNTRLSTCRPLLFGV